MEQITQRQKIINFMENLNQKFWLRMVIFFLPGLLCIKLSKNFEAPNSIYIASQILLLIGGLLSFYWVKIYNIVNPKQTEEEQAEYSNNDQNLPLDLESSRIQTPAHVHIDMIKNLINLSNGDYQSVYRLIEIESEIQPEITYTQAIEKAYKRKLIENSF